MTVMQADGPEIALVADRLALKLGCESIALIGSVRAPLIAALAARRLIGFDAPEHLDVASALLPEAALHPLEAAAATLRDAPGALAIIGTASLAQLDDESLATVVSSVPAALVIDPDGSTGRGIRALQTVTNELRERGLQCVRAELVAPLDRATQRPTRPAAVVCAGHDDRVGDLVATGLHSLRLDPEIGSHSTAGATARVCIVSYEVLGPWRNGGIGTANTSLAIALAWRGHDVTLLYTGLPSNSEAREAWRRHFEARGIAYDELSEDRVAAVGSPHINARRAWAAYEWVREQHARRPFDVIHAPECQGHMYYIALAKRHGVDFTDTELVTGVHSPTRWCAEANREPMRTLASLTDEHLERAGTEASDSVVSPSRYMVGYLRDRGWRLPERTFVQQYVTSEAIREALERRPDAPEAPGGPGSELVFFGRLEVRKGLEAFCDALDALVDDPAASRVSVTFMGSATQVGGESSDAYVQRRASGWPWATRILTDLSQPEAVSYLSGGDRVAVMPSLVDNLPNTVFEAVALGIPLIVSRSGGTWELIAAEDLERCTFAGWPEDDVVDPVPANAPARSFRHEDLVRALRGALRQHLALARPAVDRELNETVHVEWHSALAARPRPAAGPVASAPRVSRLVHWTGRADTPDDLARWSGELVVAHQSEIEPPAAVPDTTRTVDVGTATLGQAYDLAAGAATRELLLVTADGVLPDAALPDAIARAAARSDADVFLFPVRDAPAGDASGSLLVPTGGPPALALAYPFYTAGGLAIRVAALERVGGFNGSPRVTQPVVDLLNRAALAGCAIEVVPLELGRRTTPDPLRAVRSGETWIEAVSWESDPQQVLELLRPFYNTDALADLPALYRSSQELMNQLLREARERFAEWDRVGELRAHADRMALSESRLRAEIDVYRNSRSWRITAPMRALAARLRSRSPSPG